MRTRFALQYEVAVLIAFAATVAARRLSEALRASKGLEVNMTIFPPIPLTATYFQAAYSAFMGRVVPSAGLTISFALAAWGLKAVNTSGALAGAAVTFLLCMAAGPGALVAVLAVFALAYFTTRFGHQIKERLGTAEGSEGRSARQVLANLAIAGMCVTPVLWYPDSAHWVLIGVAASLAEAAADTVSSEVGQVFSHHPVLITNFRRVPPGTNGAITMVGSIMGILSATLIAYVCVAMDLIGQRWFLLTVTCATLGMFLDSLLGATLEKPDRLGNNSVNFTSTGFAAFLAILISFLVRAN